MNCEEIRPLLSGYVDGELTPDEEERLKRHLSHCMECRDELQVMRDIEGVTEAMKQEQGTLPDMFWDQYWLSVYNRLERGVGWVLLSLGASLLAAFALWHFATAFLIAPEVPLVVRVGTGLSVLGLAVLTVSIVRERVRAWTHDPYKEVKR